MAAILALLMMSGCLAAVVGPMTGSVSAADGPAITFGDPVQIGSGHVDTELLSVAMNSQTRLIVEYDDMANEHKFRLQRLYPDSTPHITLSAIIPVPSDTLPNNKYINDLVRLDDTRFLIVQHEYSASYMYAWVGTISENDISWGSRQTVSIYSAWINGYALDYIIDAVPLGSNRVAILWAGYQGGNNIASVVLDIDGDSITGGIPSPLPEFGHTNNHYLIALDPSRMVIFTPGSLIPESPSSASIATVNPDTSITTGELDYMNEAPSYPMFCPVSPTSFMLMGHRFSETSVTTDMVLCSVGENIETVDSLSIEQYVYEMVALMDEHVLLTIVDPSDFSVSLAIATIDGYNIVLGEAHAVPGIAIDNDIGLNGWFRVMAFRGSDDLIIFDNVNTMVSGHVDLYSEPPPAPIASFTASVIEGTAPLTVQFTDTSTGPPTAWEWNFDGDGVVDSTEHHPTVTYSHPGVYTVSLRVTNAGGTDYIAKQSYIVVTAPEDETDSYPSVSTEGGIAYSYGDDLTILSGDRIYLYSKWFGSPVGQISDENRAYITLDTRFISLYASSAELTLWFHRNNAGQIDVYSANFGDALQTYDWGCGVVHGSFIATASVPWGAENPVKVTIDVPIDQINVGGYTQFEIRPTNPGLSAYLYMSTGEHPPTLRVDGVTSNAISYTLANGTVHSTNLRPTISDISPVLLMYSFDIHVWEGVASVRMEKQDDWKLIGFSPVMAWVNETAEYIEFGVAVAPGTYTIQFSVPNKGPVTAHVAIYSSSTGEGFPFETFRVRVSPGTWFSGANARDVMADSIELNRGEAYTFAVSDHFGNIIATRSVLVGSGTTYISIPLDIHSFKVFNQKEDFTRFSIYYEGAGEPLRFFCAPNEPVERFLRPGDYTVVVTYYSGGVAGASEYFEISVEDAEFLMVRGNTISRVISDIQGVNALQEVITKLVTPDMVFIKEDMPTVPTGPVEYVHPWSVVTATTRQNGSGTDVEFRVPHPGAAGTTYTILDDRLYFTGAYNTEVWVNSTDGVVYHGTTLPSSIALNGQAVTVETSSPVSCERVSKWRGEDLFYYSYYTAQRRYEVTLNVNNTLDWGVLENVDWFIGFPENRSIDLSSVRIQDLDNAVWLVSGLNYDITQSGMRMTFDSLSPAAVRSFKFSMYDANATSGQGTAQATIDTYDATRYDGEPYYVGRCSWTNSFTYGYSGIYTIALTFDKARYIDPSSIVVIDRMRSRQLLPGEFTYTGSSIIISNVENVPISGVYGFEVYFWIDYGQVEKVDLGAPLPGLGVSPIVLMIVGAVGLGGAFAGSYVTRGRHTAKLGYVLLTYGSIVAIVLILSMQGMI